MRKTRPVAPRRRLQTRFAADVWELMSTDSNARTLNQPALIVHDRNDCEVSWRQGQRIADAWPGAQRLTTCGLGHRRIPRHAETVQAVVDFLGEAQGPRPLGEKREWRYAESP
jgi:hypothetical protein